MDIKAQFCTFVGASFAEIMRCFFAKIESFDNITGEGITVSSNYIYEYFTIANGEDDFRFVIRAFENTSTQRVGIEIYVASSSSSGGTGYAQTKTDLIPTPTSDTNRTTIMQYINNGRNNTFYDNCWVFSSGNDFVGMSVPFARKFENISWFLFLKNHNDAVQLLPVRSNIGTGANYIYGSDTTGQYASVNDVNLSSDVNYVSQDIADCVYIETRMYGDSITNREYIIPDLYCVYNYMIYDEGTAGYKKSFLVVGTEDGLYMHLSKDFFIKITEVLEKEITYYEAA